MQTSCLQEDSHHNKKIISNTTLLLTVVGQSQGQWFHNVYEKRSYIITQQKNENLKNCFGCN